MLVVLFLFMEIYYQQIILFLLMNSEWELLDHRIKGNGMQFRMVQPGGGISLTKLLQLLL